MALLLWLASLVAAQDCADLSVVLDSVDGHLVAERFPDAETLLVLAENSFACAAPPTKLQLARYWLASGVIEHLKANTNGSFEYFEAASSLVPGLWVEGYGQRIRGVYNRAAVGVSGKGRLELQPELTGKLVPYVDGSPVTVPLRIPTGLHLVQVYERNQPRYHQIISMGEDDLIKLDVVLTEVAEPKKVKLKKSKAESLPIFLIGAGSAAVLSGAMAGAALSQNGAMKNAEDAEGVQGAYGRQVGFAVTSYSLLGVAATGVVLHVAL